MREYRGQELELTSQAHILTPCCTASLQKWWRILVKRRISLRNGKMDRTVPAWMDRGPRREANKQAGLPGRGATQVLGLAEAFCAACMSASPAEWISDSRRLCSCRLSLAAGLCPLPRSSFNRCQGLSGSKQKDAFILRSLLSPSTAHQSVAMPPPIHLGTSLLLGTMIYSCLLKDEYHMGLII